ncbi:hypothetical protein FP73_gp052 [Bacillus phage Hoody T]|uniref:Uncharacterized protein n=2 Tax=Bastillevirus TaxID=1918010 RepID=A0A024B148_9CAUD|nr:hypothetical protein FP73_gp052 [Bacillus phage Hoody T]AHZ10364.1 hypothetical protein [Bacillus phage Hoody T]ASU00904.1 hypothetical protein ANTHONY_57 [Bacillus phage Anthony]
MEKIITKDDVLESVKELHKGLETVMILLDKINKEAEAQLEIKVEAAPESLTQFIDHFLDEVNYHKDDRESYFDKMKEAIKIIIKQHGYFLTTFQLDDKLHTYQVSVNAIGVSLEERLDGGTEPKQFYYEFSYEDKVELGIVPSEEEEEKDACYEEYGAYCCDEEPCEEETEEEETEEEALEFVVSIVDTQLNYIKHSIENIKEEIEDYFGLQKLKVDDLEEDEFDLLRTYLTHVTEEDAHEVNQATNRDLVRAWNLLMYRKNIL